MSSVATLPATNRIPKGAAASYLILIVAFSLLTVFYSAFRPGTVIDDALISIRYAENGALGDGLVLNPGGERVEGYTNFLWVVQLAILIKLGIDPVIGSQFLGLTYGALVLFLTGLVARRIFGSLNAHCLFLLPSMLLVLSPDFRVYSFAGLETSSFAFWILATVFFLLRDSAWLAGVSIALATMTRPEGFALFWLAAVFYGFSVHLRHGTDSATCIRRRILAFTGVYALIFGAYFLWRFNYFGYLLPNTFYMKTGGGWFQYVRGMRYSFRFFGKNPLMYFWLPILGLGAMLMEWQEGTTNSAQNEGKPLRWSNLLNTLRLTARPTSVAQVWQAFSLATIALFCAYIVYVGGDAFLYSRFFVPILPFILMVPCAGISFIIHAFEQRGQELKIRPNAGLIALSCFLCIYAPIEIFQQREFGSLPTSMSRGYETYVVQAKQLSEILQAHDLIAAEAIGAMTYYTKNPVLDVLGKADIHIAHQPSIGMGKGIAGHEKGDPEYVLSRKPKYIVFASSLSSEPEIPKLSYDWGPLLISNPVFQSEYRPLHLRIERGCIYDGLYFNLYERIE